MLTKLITIQRTNGWSDAVMAARLSVARSTWTGIRNGNLALSHKVQMTAARVFPELLADLLGTVSAAPSEPDRAA